MKLISSLIVCAAVAAFAPSARAQCLVDFNNEFALSQIYDQARTHFATESRFDANGKLESCYDPGSPPDKHTFKNDSWRSCWDWRERCGTGGRGGSPYYVNAWPWGGNAHFHMFFEDPKVQEFTCLCDPNDGYGSGLGFNNNGACDRDNCPKWEQLGRMSIYPHTSSHWVYIWMEKGGDSRQHVFTFQDITIPMPQQEPGKPPPKPDDYAAQVWYVKANGETWGWKKLLPGYHILNATGATSVWIGKASGKGGPVEIEDYVALPED